MRAPVGRRGFLGSLVALAAAPALGARPWSAQPNAELAPIALRVDRYDSEKAPIRVLESEVDFTDGGALELSLAECDYPEDYPSGSIWLGVHQADSHHDHAWGCHVLPEELDALLANLSALRERARTIGILPGRG